MTTTTTPCAGDKQCVNGATLTGAAATTPTGPVNAPAGGIAPFTDMEKRNETVTDLREPAPVLVVLQAQPRLAGLDGRHSSHERAMAEGAD